MKRKDTNTDTVQRALRFRAAKNATAVCVEYDFGIEQPFDAAFASF